MRHWCCVLAVAAIACACFAPTRCEAQVYAADWATGYIYSYDDTVATVINPSQQIPSPLGMSLDEEGWLVISQPIQGIILRLNPDDQTVQIISDAVPGGLDAYPDAGPDIYAVRNPGDGLHPELVTLVVGPSPARPILEFQDSDELADVQVYPMGESAGNILVLSRTPGFLAEIRRNALWDFERLDDVVSDIPGDPVGFSITPGGDIVILDSDDGMFLVTPSGLEPFGSAGGPGLERISIASEGAIFITDGYTGVIHRFDSDGNPILPDLDGGIVHPRGIVAASFIPTPPGGNVPSNPLGDVEMLFEYVARGGFTIASATVSEGRVSPEGNFLPDYVDPPGGERGEFIYVSLGTQAVHENVVQVDVLQEGTRMFFAHGTGETFHDVTVEGSIEDARGIISRFSEVVLVEDNRALLDVVDDKIDRLETEMEAASQIVFGPCVVNAFQLLKQQLETAVASYGVGAIGQAIEELQELNDMIRAYAGTCIPNSPEYEEGNVAGELLSLSKTLMFSLGLLQPEGDAEGRARATGEAQSVLALEVASPARGECRFELVGPVGARATVRVYDVSGRLVDTVFDGRLDGGREALIWDGLDGSGHRAASGVYLAKVEGCGEEVKASFVLIR